MVVLSGCGRQREDDASASDPNLLDEATINAALGAGYAPEGAAPATEANAVENEASALKGGGNQTKDDEE
jgi:hypothetical protein